MSEQTIDREAQIREIAKKTVVYHMPGVADVFVRGSTYTTGQGELAMDIYYPSTPMPGDRFPVVVMPFGYPDPPGHVRRWGPITSWARLLAASEMAAVIYGTNEPAEDIHALLRHVRANAAELKIDDQRIGLWAGSASVAVALSALMRDPSFTCATLLYGYTMDLDGSTTVADAAKQFLFVNACAGKSVDDLPDHVPMLFVRAGREQFPGLNDALDKVVVRALARNLPVTLVNHATGAHGFDCDEDTTRSRGIIQQVLAFVRLHLEA